MFVRYEVLYNENTKRFTTIAHCTCDIEECKKPFIIDKNVRKRLAGPVQYCSPEHAKLGKEIGGASALRREKTCLERYGSKTYISQPHLASEYGNRAWKDAPREKRTSTLIERYGVDNPWNIEGVHEKATAAQTSEGKLRRLEKSEITMLERYGVRNGLQLPKTREAMNSPEAWEKRSITMRKNGSFNTSIPQKKLGAMLRERFGDDDIQEHVHLVGDKRHTIDFYVISIDTFIQQDGVYWHGLDRSPEEVKMNTSKQGKVIYRKWLWDRFLDNWCIENGKKLIRVTDLEVNAPSFSLIHLF